MAQANKTAGNASDERKEADQAYWLADLASRNAAFLAGTDAGDPKDGFLKNSYSLLNKNENLTSTDGYNAATAKAQLAVQDYLDKTQNHNIYGALSSFALDSVRTYRNESLNQATHLSAGEVKTNASVIAHKNNYRDMADSSTSTGVLMNTEVGLTDNLTLGVSAGAAKEKLNGKQSTYVKGDSIYSGAYLNTGVGNFNLITGAAYEKINLKGQRTINNGYDAQQFDVKLAPTILTAYTQARYAIPFGDTFSIVPKIGMAYNSVKIDAINESGSGALRVEQKRQNTIEALVGQDFVANIQTGSGKFSTKVSLDYVHTSGQKDLSASFQNGNSFNLNTEKNPNSFNIGTYAEYQWNSGVSVKAGLNNAFRSSGSAMSGLVGMGYKF